MINVNIGISSDWSSIQLDCNYDFMTCIVQTDLHWCICPKAEWLLKYLCWTVPIKVSIIVGKKGVHVVFSLVKYVSSVFKTYVFFLLHCLSDVLDRISSPNLSFLDDSTWRNNAIRSYDTSFLKDCPFHDDWIMAYICSPFEPAWVESAVVLDDVVSFHEELSSKSCGRGCCCM